MLLRGLPIERYTEDELRIVYWGLGLHLGTPRYQNPDGELIGDVRDENRLYGSVREAAPTGEARSSRNKARSAGPCASTPTGSTSWRSCASAPPGRGPEPGGQLGGDPRRILVRRPDLLEVLYRPTTTAARARKRREKRRLSEPDLRAEGRAVHQPVLAIVRRVGAALPGVPC